MIYALLGFALGAICAICVLYEVSKASFARSPKLLFVLGRSRVRPVRLAALQPRRPARATSSQPRASARPKFRDFLPHNFAGLEFHGRSRRNHEAAAGLIRIATDPRLREFDLEDAEVAKFHGIALCQCIGDVIQRLLDDFEDLVLDQACFVTYFNDEFPFR